MITPQIIHTEPDHPVLHHPSMQAYTNYNTNPEVSDGSNRNGSGTSSESAISSQKKPKKEVDSSKPYKCVQCEYSFNRRDHLTRHALVHSKLKPYHCNFCSKDFTRNDHLRRHQQRVHGEEGN